MGAECSRCGNDIYDECGYCNLRDERDALLAKRDALREAGEGLLRIVVDEYGDPAEDEDVADLSWLDAAVSAWRAATGEGGAASGQPAPPESQ